MDRTLKERTDVSLKPRLVWIASCAILFAPMFLSGLAAQSAAAQGQGSSPAPSSSAPSAAPNSSNSPQSEAPAPAPSVQASGLVHTAAGTPVPGATVRLVEISTGRSWLTWSDENGKFVLPPLAPGRYRIEASQLGLSAFTKEIDLTPNPAAIDLPLAIETLAEIDSENNGAAAASAAPAAAPGAPGAPHAAASASTSTAASASAPSGKSSAQATAAPNSARQSASNSQGGGNPQRRPGGFGPGGGPGGGGRRGGFQQVGLNGQNQQNAGDTGAEAGAPPADQGQGAIGQASSSDAFLMTGTVGVGVMGGGDMFGAGQGGPLLGA